MPINALEEKDRRVRLIGDPTRIGFLTGRVKTRRNKLLIQVRFTDQTSWIPEEQLELLPVERESPIDLLISGKLGRAMDLRRTLAHVRLTGKLADIIYSMEATNTDFYSYQFKPVLRFLNSPSSALLIADEVGLGKTIEAGLIWTELRSRYDSKRLLVLCPAMLREKWRLELLHKIGVEAHILDAKELLNRLKDPIFHTKGFAIICSLEGTRPHRGWRNNDGDNSNSAELARFLIDMAEEKPIIDLLIIDEAHYLRNSESQTHELGRLFRPLVEHFLLLTATPIHNYNFDLFALLQLLDIDVFQRQEDLQAILEASRPLVRARDIVLSAPDNAAELDTVLEEANSHPLLKDNRQLALIRERIFNDRWLHDQDKRAELASRLEMVNPLAYVITRTRKRDVKEWRVIRDPVPQVIQMTHCEQRFYSKVTEYVISYSMKRAVSERFLLSIPQRQMSSSMPAALRTWLLRRKNINEDEEWSSDTQNEKKSDLGPLAKELALQSQNFGNLEELIANDSKYGQLIRILQDFLKKYPREKVVLFASFRETLSYLSERLTQDGIVNIVMHGGIDEPKDSVLNRFENDSTIRILLSSEIGSEGIDLQFSRIIINYDLPWNPMRIEQRIGRLDRLGQKAEKILIWNLFYGDTIDARIYERLYDKLDLCRRALGDFEAVLGSEIRKLTVDLLSDCLTPEQQEQRIEQTAQALANLKQEQDKLEEEASSLVAYGDYILNQIQAAKDLNRWITGEDLRDYVVDFFKTHYPGCIFNQIGDNKLSYNIKLSTVAANNLDAYIHNNHISFITQLARGGHRPVRCRFENRTTFDINLKEELISQFHPLVRFVNDEITKKEEQLTPAVAIKIVREKGINIPKAGIYIIAGARWSVKGLQTIEKLVFAAAPLNAPEKIFSPAIAEQIASVCARYGQDWFEAQSDIGFSLTKVAELIDEHLFGQLDEDYKEFIEDIKRRNEDRIDLQLRNLERHLSRTSSTLKNVKHRHLEAGRESLAKATQGKLEALQHRIEMQKQRIESMREIKHQSSEILVAVVLIQN